MQTVPIASSPPPRQRWRDLLAGALLVLLTAAAYLPVLHAGFVWDDVDYVVDCAPLRSVAGLEAIWLDRDALPVYYPLTHTTYWIEYQLFGLRPLGYHIDSVAVHVLCVLLAWRLLRRLRVPGAWLAAAIFALHPLHAESVAWVSERKNLLATLSYLLAMIVAVRWWGLDAPQTSGEVAGGEVAAGGASRVPRLLLYLLCLLLYVAAMLSKTIACTLPAAVLVLVWWRRGRITRRDLLPTLSFFLVGLLLALNTATLERSHFSTRGPGWEFSPAQRLLIAGQLLRFTVQKLLWPHPLMPIYPRVVPDVGSPAQLAAPVLAAAVVVVLWLLRRRLGRGPLAAVLLTGVALAPALGAANINFWRFSFVADHFVYPATIGLIVLAAAAIDRAAAMPAARAAVAAAVLLVLGLLTYDRARAFGSPQSLWADNVRKNPASPGAHVNYALALTEQGRPGDAEAQYRAALASDPDYPPANANLAGLLLRAARPREAIPFYLRSLAWHDDPEMRLDLGIALERGGDAAAARREYAAAARLRPAWADPYAHAARLALLDGDLPRADLLYRQALALAPNDFDAHLNLGTLRAREGKFRDAAGCFRNAVALQPNSIPARRNLITALVAAGDPDAASVEIDRLLALDPADAQAYNSRGLIAAARRDYAAAEAAFAKAAALDPTFAAARNNFAAAKAARQRTTTTSPTTEH